MFSVSSFRDKESKMRAKPKPKEKVGVPFGGYMEPPKYSSAFDQAEIARKSRMVALRKKAEESRAKLAQEKAKLIEKILSYN